MPGFFPRDSHSVELGRCEFTAFFTVIWTTLRGICLEKCILSQLNLRSNLQKEKEKCIPSLLYHKISLNKSLWKYKFFKSYWFRICYMLDLMWLLWLGNFTRHWLRTKNLTLIGLDPCFNINIKKERLRKMQPH